MYLGNYNHVWGEKQCKTMDINKAHDVDVCMDRCCETYECNAVNYDIPAGLKCTLFKCPHGIEPNGQKRNGLVAWGLDKPLGKKKETLSQFWLSQAFTIFIAECKNKSPDTNHVWGEDQCEKTSAKKEANGRACKEKCCNNPDCNAINYDIPSGGICTSFICPPGTMPNGEKRNGLVGWSVQKPPKKGWSEH